MNIWSILKISPTHDHKLIKKAYATQLKVTNPEDNPSAFKELRQAYEMALGQQKEISTPKQTAPHRPSTTIPKLRTPTVGEPEPLQLTHTINTMMEELLKNDPLQVFKQWVQEGVFVNLELSLAFQAALIEELLISKKFPLPLFMEACLKFSWQELLIKRDHSLHKPIEEILDLHPELYSFIEFLDLKREGIEHALYASHYQIASFFLNQLDLSVQDQWYTYASFCNLAETMGYGSLGDDTNIRFGIGMMAHPVKISSLSKYLQALYRNDLDTLQHCLKQGADPNQIIYHGLGPLHIAIQQGHHKLIDLLIEAGANINLVADPFQYSPLFIAVKYQNVYAINKLFALDAQDLPTFLFHTALMAAVYNNDLPTIRKLVERGSDIKQARRDKAFTLVYTAARYQHREVLKYFLSLDLHPDWQPEMEPGLSYEFYAKHDVPFTPLTAAIKNHDIKSVHMLLDAGADSSKLSNGMSPIDYAKPHPEILDLFL